MFHTILFVDLYLHHHCKQGVRHFHSGKECLQVEFNESTGHHGMPSKSHCQLHEDKQISLIFHRLFEPIARKDCIGQHFQFLAQYTGIITARKELNANDSKVHHIVRQGDCVPHKEQDIRHDRT